MDRTFYVLRESGDILYPDLQLTGPFPEKTHAVNHMKKHGGHSVTTLTRLRSRLKLSEHRVEWAEPPKPA